jgi:tetratricopeptide (TPR) repeat protein
MCAECHSTGLRKNYDLGTNTFDTDWTEINVACEACHGPGSQHGLDPETGFAVDLNDAGDASWRMNVATGIAQRSEPRTDPPVQPEACGRCHSRRGNITADYDFGRPLTDTHLPSLLEENLYYPDGQIREEVYVYGSFLQSKMYQSGVTCSDCHDPHSANLKTGGKASEVCSTCHLPTRFALPEHHHHSVNDVECVDCHMPSRTYMVVDPRRDHSFRVPSPALTLTTGSPNACNGCHSDKDAAWAANAVQTWYGEPADETAHYGEAIHAGRSDRPDANGQLVDVINNESSPGIARATALTLLAAPFADDAAAAIKSQLSSADPLIRIAALRAMEGIAPDFRAQWAAPLLRDPIRAVRIEAVNALSPARATLRQADQDRFKAAEGEYFAAQLAIAERPESHINLGNLYVERGDAVGAERSYLLALQMEPRAVAARANLADLYRQTQRDADAEKLLRDGIAIDDESAALHHSLGLMLVRGDQTDAALIELGRAAELDPGNARFVYVSAVALNSLGEPNRAVAILEDARDTFPANYDIAWALATIYRDLGQTDDARAAAERLLKQFPNDQNSRSLLDSL